jgi:hypothetical protein
MRSCIDARPRRRGRLHLDRTECRLECGCGAMGNMANRHARKNHRRPATVQLLPWTVAGARPAPRLARSSCVSVRRSQPRSFGTACQTAATLNSTWHNPSLGERRMEPRLAPSGKIQIDTLLNALRPPRTGSHLPPVVMNARCHSRLHVWECRWNGIWKLGFGTGTTLMLILSPLLFIPDAATLPAARRFPPNSNPTPDRLRPCRC